jgi:hypothetical protein
MKSNNNSNKKDFYLLGRWEFMPVRAPAGWTAEQDLQDFEDRFGDVPNLWRDIEERFERNLQDLGQIMDSGIVYFAGKQGVSSSLPPLESLVLEDKIRLFTDLLPTSDNKDYIQRFTVCLGQVLWYRSEHTRVRRQHSERQWLYLLHDLADRFASLAFELDEALCCEHDDYPPGGSPSSAD